MQPLKRNTIPALELSGENAKNWKPPKIRDDDKDGITKPLRNNRLLLKWYLGNGQQLGIVYFIWINAGNGEHDG